MISSSLSTLSIAPSSKDLISRKSSQSLNPSNTLFKIEEQQIIDSLAFAKCVKYYAQFSNPHIFRPIPFDRISAKILYKAHKDSFDMLFAIFRKFGLKLSDYVVFFIGEMHFGISSIDMLFSKDTFQLYVKFLTSKAQVDKVCQLMIESAQFLAMEAKRRGENTAIGCLKAIIKDRTLANYFFAGKLSAYFLASIVGFKAVIPKLDKMTQDELSPLDRKFESYRTIAYSAFEEKYGKAANAIELTDGIISGKLTID